MPMQAVGIEARVRSYLHRQITWLEEYTAQLGPLDPIEESARILQLLKLWEHEAAQFTIEQQGLLHEWEGGHHALPPEREAIRALARRAEVLSNEASDLVQCTLVKIEEAQGTDQSSMHTLRRTRETLSKYRPFAAEDPQCIDRKA